jgi:pimeloyl-ACP methyl ester carboxylesterase
MRQTLFLLLALLWGLGPPAGIAAAEPHTGGLDLPAPCVILLHGLGRRAASMTPMANDLASRGYRVYNTSYPSTEAPVEALADTYLLPVVAQCRQGGCRVIHVVAHSLGAIMIRQYLQTRQLPAGSRIVMLSPPNQGSEVADVLAPYFFYRWIMGPAGQQLGTASESLPGRLLPVDGAIGVITGNHSWNLILSMMIPGPDDGKVSVESAKLAGMDDFLVLPVTHTFIMQDAEAMAQTAHFLAYGRFDHSRPDDAPDGQTGSARTVYRDFER